MNIEYRKSNEQALFPRFHNTVMKEALGNIFILGSWSFPAQASHELALTAGNRTRNIPLGQTDPADDQGEGYVFGLTPQGLAYHRAMPGHNADMTDGPDGVNVDLQPPLAPVRFEILEWGAGICDGPQYVIGTENAPYPKPTQTTRSDAPIALRDIVIRPYADMKRWEMNGGVFRTPPLWGLGRNLDMLARNNRPARFMHDQDGAESQAAFYALSAEEQPAIITFLTSL